MAIELEPWFSVMPSSEPTMTLVRALLEYPGTNDNVLVRIRKTPQGFIVNDGGPLAKYVGIATMRRRDPRFTAGVERLLTGQVRRSRIGMTWGDRAESGESSAVSADVKDSCRLMYGQTLYARDENTAR